MTYSGDMRRWVESRRSVHYQAAFCTKSAVSVEAGEHADALQRALQLQGERAAVALAEFRSASTKFAALDATRRRGGFAWLGAGVALQRARLVLRHAVILEECGGGSC